MDRRIFTCRWRKLTPAGVLMTGAVCFKWGRGTWWDAAWAPLELFLTNDVNCCCSSTPPWAREAAGGWDEEPDSFSRKSVTPRLNPPFVCLTNLRFGLASLDRRSWDLICPSKILCQGTFFWPSQNQTPHPPRMGPQYSGLQKGQLFCNLVNDGSLNPWESHGQVEGKEESRHCTYLKCKPQISIQVILMENLSQFSTLNWHMASCVWPASTEVRSFAGY